VRYLDVGEGPPILLMHTVRTQLDYFQKVIPVLARQRHRVIALDYPGAGRSSIPRDAAFDEPFYRRAVIEFIEALDLHDLILAGESMGGVLALTVAAELPDRVSRVVSLNPYDYGEKFGGGLRRSRFGFLIAPFRLFRSLSFEPTPLLRLVMSGGFANPKALPRGLLKEYRRAGKRKGYSRGEFRLYKNWKSWVDARRLYGGVRAPITLTYGALDWSDPSERAADRKLLEPEQYTVFADASHFSSLEVPDAVADAILAH
jgi:pimeloyl-ACP methyl ester carboxylesterase